MSSIAEPNGESIPSSIYYTTVFQFCKESFSRFSPMRLKIMQFSCIMRVRNSLTRNAGRERTDFMKVKRVFLIVLDSFGIGAMPDADKFGDRGCHTLASVSRSPLFHAPTMHEMGLGNIKGSAIAPVKHPTAAHARLKERSAGKDTVIGHWEIAGLVSDRPLPTYPNGFPTDLLDRIEKETGIGAICNLPYSGTQVIRDYGEEMMRSGKVIVYTSADSVYQVAAHEDVIPPEKLYEYCRTARRLLCNEHAVGRVIARPFIGDSPETFVRTANRHDFALDVPGTTMLDLLAAAGKEVIGVGKIGDIFNMRGITRTYPTGGNQEGMKITAELAKEDFEGLCFVNLVDFDMLYGHRRDPDGYARAISEFDAWLAGFLPCLSQDDVLMITADHGCDPCAGGTDHTREYVPLLVYSNAVHPCSLGERGGFCDIGATVCALLGADPSPLHGRSFDLALRTGCSAEDLLAQAEGARKRAYAPYSGFSVGAALLGKSGKIYLGCNIENAAFSPTICAERAAFAQAISAGEREFEAIAVVGGKGETVTDVTRPCGVCRQVMHEFCPPAFPIIMKNSRGAIEIVRLDALLPFGFDASSFSES